MNGSGAGGTGGPGAGGVSCEDAVGLIVDSLMDTLSGEQSDALARHLDTCASCAGEAERLRSAWSDLATLPGLEVDARQSAAGAAAVMARVGATGAQSPSVGALRWAASLALLLVGGGAGYLAGGGFGPGATDSLPMADAVPDAGPAGAQPGTSTFILLVRGAEPDRTVPSQTLTAEYLAWAGGLAEEGRLVAAEKLTDEPGRWVTSPAAVDERVRSDVQGYFVIRAATYDEAVRVARASPHVAYGGTFEVRMIDPVG